MKKIIILMLMSVLFLACGEESSETKTETVYIDPTPPPVVDPPGETPEGNVLAVIYTENAVLFNYINMNVTMFSEKGFKISERKICVGDKIHTYMTNGALQSSYQLNHFPDAGIMSGTDIYTAVNITPQESMDAGMLPRWHTKFYKNNIEYGQIWSDNEYETIKMICTDIGEIVAVDTGYHFRAINGDKTIMLAENNGALIVSDDNDTNKSDIFNGNVVNYSQNYFFGIYSTIKVDGKYYTNNGYTYDGTLGQLVNCLADYTITPKDKYRSLMVAARFEDGHDRIYYIECGTGWLCKYTIDFDTYEYVVRFYLGDGQTYTASAYLHSLDPVVNGNKMYYTLNGAIYAYDFENEFSTVLYANDGEAESL